MYNTKIIFKKKLPDFFDNAVDSTAIVMNAWQQMCLWQQMCTVHKALIRTLNSKCTMKLCS